MSRIAIALVTCLCVCGCGSNDDTKTKPTQTQQLATGDALHVVEFDGHEYVLYDVFRGGGICHKANCKYCE